MLSIQELTPTDVDYFFDKVVVTSVCVSFLRKGGPPSRWWSCKSVSKVFPLEIWIPRFFDLKVHDPKKHEKKKPSEHVFNLEKFSSFSDPKCQFNKDVLWLKSRKEQFLFCKDHSECQHHCVWESWSVARSSSAFVPGNGGILVVWESGILLERLEVIHCLQTLQKVPSDFRC